MKKILGLWDRAESSLVGILGFIGTVIQLYSIVMRYFFKNPPEWTEEIVIYIFIMAFYITASTLVGENGHVKATFIVDRLPVKYRKIMEIITAMLALIFCLVVTYFAVVIVKMAMVTGERSETSIRFPMWISYLSVPIGTSLISLRYVKQLFDLIFSTPSKNHSENNL